MNDPQTMNQENLQQTQETGNPCPNFDENTLLPKPTLIMRIPSSENEIGECVFYILGTAHVSRQSCDDAALLIKTIQPDLVMVELCSERQPILQVDKIKVYNLHVILVISILSRHTNRFSHSTKATYQLPLLFSQEPSLSEVLSEIRSGRATPFQAIYSWLLARVGNGLDVMPGEEFRVAVQEAQAVGASVVLGDRPLNITLSRVWYALSSWEKIKLSFSLLWTGLSMLDKDEMLAEIERMKETDVLTEAILEFSKEFPSLMGPLLTERDEFMVHVMRRLSSRARRVVAVVGAGHLEGIRQHWEAEIDIEEICRVPHNRPGRNWGRIVLLAATGAIVVYGASRWRRRY